jgi:thiol-disulfide isomerase/thioredoxin
MCSISPVESKIIIYIECRCGHCKELAPKYREAASLLATADLPRPVVLAKYDDSTDSQRRLRAGAEDVFNYNAYPALIIFDDGKHKPYTGGRNTQDIVTFMTAYSKGLDPHIEEIKTKPGLYKDLPDYDPNIFLDFDPDTFKSTVLTDMQVPPTAGGPARCGWRAGAENILSCRSSHSWERTRGSSSKRGGELRRRRTRVGQADGQGRDACHGNVRREGGTESPSPLPPPSPPPLKEIEMGAARSESGRLGDGEADGGRVCDVLLPASRNGSGSTGLAVRPRSARPLPRVRGARGSARAAGRLRGRQVMWVIEFYSDQCPMCKSLVPEILKVR